jgi:hypothetical protein
MAEKIPNRKTSADQEPIVDPEETKQYGWNQTTYKKEYALKAYQLLSGSMEAKTKAHLCAAFQCSKPTLLNWMKKNPEFKEAVEQGLKVGESKWRSRIAKYAFEPTSLVNNGLIKLLSSNVYGIKEDIEPAVQVNQYNNSDPEAELVKRGIPIPIIASEDVDDK